MVLTFKFRICDKHSADLNRQARAINFVWNYCNETQRKAVQSGRKWLSGVDLQKLTAGSSRELNLDSQSICKVCRQYDHSRKQQKKPWLRFRGRKSLGWVPYKKGYVRVLEPGKFKFYGRIYETMHWRELPVGAVILGGSFNQDARGRWYINCLVETPEGTVSTGGPVGIDLGLKNLATLSTGEKIEAPQHYRRLQDKFGKAQRATKKKLARSISAKIGNCRRDHLHKASARIALAHSIIVVGNVSSEKLARTRMAKSVLDAGWSTFRNQLSYKAIRHGGTFIEVNEAYTTQTCSSCGSLPEGRPEGIAGLGIRQWQCGDCGATHDRDVNAALNIARLGLETLVEGAAHRAEQSS